MVASDSTRGDAGRAIEAARRVHLRTQLSALRTVAQQCHDMQSRAEATARNLTEQNHTLEGIVAVQKQEMARLRLQVAGFKEQAKQGRTVAELTRHHTSKLSAAALEAERRRASMASRLSAADELASAISKTLVEERTSASKLVDSVQARAERAEREGEEAMLAAQRKEEEANRRIGELEFMLGDLRHEARYAKGAPTRARWKRMGKLAGTHGPHGAAVPPGGSIGDGGVVLDANGRPVLGPDGKPIVLQDSRVPPGGTIGRGGVVLDAFGRPVLGDDGKPIFVDPRVPPGGSISASGDVLDAAGNPVLGADGKPLKITDPRIPPGGKIGRGGIILGADGKPVLGSDGKPIYTDPRVPVGGSVGACGIILDANGKPLLGKDGKPLYADSRVPPGGSIRSDGVIVDAHGTPLVGTDGQPLMADPLLVRGPPGSYVSANGVIVDADGKPVLDSHGRPQYADPRIPPGGSVDPRTGKVLDANGRPVVGADGKPVYADPRVPPGGSIGADGVIRDASGRPVAGDDGHPLYVDPRIPPGGSVDPKTGQILDARGQPVLDADGRPMCADPRIPPGGSVDPRTGQILDASGAPLVDANGDPLFLDPRIPPGSRIRDDGVLVDADGNEILDDDGKPLTVNDDEGSPGGGGGRGSTRGRRGSIMPRGRRVRNSEVTPAGRLVTIRRICVRDVPDVDLRGGDNNVSDPYLTFSLMRDKDEVAAQAKLPHQENKRNARWNEVLTLFTSDEEAPSGKTKELRVKVELWDKNKKRADTFIGDVEVSLKIGAGRVKVEVPSRSPSSLRPHVYFHYCALPQMFFEQVEWVRLAPQIEKPQDDDEADSDGVDDDD